MEIENGKYRARAADAVLSDTDSGKEQVAIQFAFLDHPGVTLTWYGFFTEATYERTVQSLRYCGWAGNDLSVFLEDEIAKNGIESTGLTANEVVLVVENEEYNGKVRPRVRWVNSAGGMGVKNVMSRARAVEFSARMKGLIVAMDKRGGSPKPAAARASDGDVPF